MDETARALLDAMVAAFPRFVEERIAARGWPPVPDAVAEAAAALGTALDELLSLPFSRQPRGPLELFQEAMAGPTAALAAAGVEPVERDPVAESALPGDVFDLAPASSADLGDEVWRAHVAWGVAKAAANRPTVLMVSRNLLDIDRVRTAVEGSGFRVITSSDDGDAVVAFVDLEHREADAEVASLSAAGVRVIAFGPHVDDIAMVRARSLGAADAVPRSVFFRDPKAFLPAFA